MNDLQALEQIATARERLKSEIGKIIVGQQEVIDHLLIALFTRGHVLLVGVPGLAKTLMIRSLARALALSFNRIQFTPDLMPSDITGTEIIEENRSTGKKEFRFIRGPLFAQVVLADEVNRTPPKTQAALLQAMQEREVSVGGETYYLDEPFFVLATQNPIEQEGTYPLPEAQLDRFMFNVLVDYPSSEEEIDIVRNTTSVGEGVPEMIMPSEEILSLQKLVRRVPVAETVVKYAVDLARCSRPNDPDAPGFVRELIRWGAGPRAGQFLVLGAKARAALDGRPTPEVKDVRALAKPVMRHRLVRTFRAEADGVSTDELIDRLLDDCKTVAT